MRMTELRALARGHELRGYSKLRKAELIAFLQDNENRAHTQPAPSTGPSGAPQQPVLIIEQGASTSAGPPSNNNP